jgi:hypothetical protein
MVQNITLVKLNLIVASLNVASTTTGYNGYLINCLQFMKPRNVAMGNATGSTLGHKMELNILITGLDFGL